MPGGGQCHGAVGEVEGVALDDRGDGVPEQDEAGADAGYCVGPGFDDVAEDDRGGSDADSAFDPDLPALVDQVDVGDGEDRDGCYQQGDDLQDVADQPEGGHLVFDGGAQVGGGQEFHAAAQRGQPLDDLVDAGSAVGADVDGGGAVCAGRHQLLCLGRGDVGVVIRLRELVVVDPGHGERGDLA